jgi:hypothetical protein
MTASASMCSAATSSTQHSPYEVSPRMDTLEKKVTDKERFGPGAVHVSVEKQSFWSRTRLFVTLRCKTYSAVVVNITNNRWKIGSWTQSYDRELQRQCCENLQFHK